MKNPKGSKRRQQSDSSNSELVTNIHELTEQATNIFLASPEYIKKLEENNVGLQQMVDLLNHQLTKKTEEIQHLMEMLAKTVPVIGEAKPLILSDEEVIAEFQLKALKSAAMTRDLTLDEVKRYDLLVKNKRLAQGNATTIDGSAKRLPANTDSNTLIQIASRRITEE